MPNDFSNNNPRSVWRNQPTEPSVMSPETIQQRVRQLRAKTHRQLLGNLALLLFVLAFYVLSMKHFPALEPLLLVAIAWSLAGLYFLNRGMWPAAMPGDAALTTGLEFYRREIDRRRHLFRRTLLWSFGPLVLALGTFLLALSIQVKGRGIFPNAMPFMTLVVVWIVAYFVVRMREQRELEREADQLNQIESGNRQ
jgi:hypothetical protein